MKINSLKALLTICALILCAAAAPRDPLARLKPGEAGTVISVADGDTLTIRYKGQPLRVRLVGASAPEIPHGGPTGPMGLYGHQARKALESLVMGKRVGLYYGGQTRDRYGRALAHVRLQDNNRAGLWIQGALIERGFARVYTFADNRAVADLMYAREAKARAAKRGVWALPFYGIRQAQALGRGRDLFQVVEGRVVDAAHIKDRTYLNFARDWRSDFTVMISDKDARRFKSLGRDPMSYEGKRIRVRGWVFEKNGPMIKADHPEQIEVLGK